MILCNRKQPAFRPVRVTQLLQSLPGKAKRVLRRVLSPENIPGETDAETDKLLLPASYMLRKKSVSVLGTAEYGLLLTLL